MKGVNVILIFDACRSATIGMGADGIRKVSEYLEAKRNGEILMVASSKGQEALEFTEIGHGLFTHTLLSGLYGLADRNNDGVIKGFEISAYLEEQVATQSRNKQFPFIDFNDYKSSTFAIVDPEAKAAISKSTAAAGNVDVIAAVSSTQPAAQGRSASASPEFIKLEEEFHKALAAGRLTKPENGSALHWYNKLLTTDPTNERLDLIKLDLAAALLSAAQQVLLNDISGIRLYTRINPANPGERRNGYNLRYYSDALLLLQQYTTLTKSKLDEETECLQSYLMARDLIINSIGLKQEEEKALEQKARQVLENALAKCGSKAYIHFATGQSLGFALENQQRARALFRKASQLAPNWSFPYNSIGQSFRRVKQFDSAVFYYQKAIKLNPLDVFPVQGIGYVHYNKAEYEKALGYFLQVYRKDTLQVESIALVADCYRLLGKPDQSLAWLKRGIRLDKTYPEWYENLGRYYQFTRQMPDSAVYFYRQAIKMSPHIGYLYRRVAEVQNSIGDFESSMNSALQAIELDPSDAFAYSTIAFSYEKQQLNELALENYDKAIELAPTEPGFAVDKGYHLYRIGKFQEAFDVLQKSNVRNVYTTQVMAESCLILGKLGDANTLITESLNFEVNNPWSNYVMARTQAALNQFSGALNYLEKALQNGLNRDVVVNRGEFTAIKETKEFRKLLKQYGVDY